MTGESNWRKDYALAAEYKKQLDNGVPFESMIYQGTPVLDPNRRYSIAVDLGHPKGDFTGLAKLDLESLLRKCKLRQAKRLPRKL